jgi:hypothetical protein
MLACLHGRRAQAGLDEGQRLQVVTAAAFRLGARAHALNELPQEPCLFRFAPRPAALGCNGSSGRPRSARASPRPRRSMPPPRGDRAQMASRREPQAAGDSGPTGFSVPVQRRGDDERLAGNVVERPIESPEARAGGEFHPWGRPNGSDPFLSSRSHACDGYSKRHSTGARSSSMKPAAASRSRIQYRSWNLARLGSLSPSRLPKGRRLSTSPEDAGEF